MSLSRVDIARGDCLSYTSIVDRTACYVDTVSTTVCALMRLFAWSTSACFVIVLGAFPEVMGIVGAICDLSFVVPVQYHEVKRWTVNE